MASEELPDSVMAPSPTPELHQGDDDTVRDPSPDAPDDDEIQKMRQSAEDVQEKLLKGKGKGKEPEAELSDMVLRLTTAALSLRTQVLSQADTIAQLSMQRKYLVQRMDEDKQLWDGERENWSRVAETLVAQLNKASPNIYKEQVSYLLVEFPLAVYVSFHISACFACLSQTYALKTFPVYYMHKCVQA